MKIDEKTRAAAPQETTMAAAGGRWPGRLHCANIIVVVVDGDDDGADGDDGDDDAWLIGCGERRRRSRRRRRRRGRQIIARQMGNVIV